MPCKHVSSEKMGVKSTTAQRRWRGYTERWKTALSVKCSVSKYFKTAVKRMMFHFFSGSAWHLRDILRQHRRWMTNKGNVRRYSVKNS